jgi:MFS family permease
MPESKRFRFIFHPPYFLLQIARLCSMNAIQILSISVAWHVYELTNSALQLGYVGLSLFVPTFLFSFFGGDLADRFSRKWLIITAYSLMTCVSGCLYAFVISNQDNVLLIYGLVMFMGLARALGGPASAAILPSLVERSVLPRALAFGSSLWQLAAILGPAVGGFLFSLNNSPELCYQVAFLLFISAVLTLFFLQEPTRTRITNRESMLLRLREGVRYVIDKKILLGAISMDLFAVLLGGAVALLPIFAKDILEVGPDGLGVLRAMPAAGATVTAIFLSFFSLSNKVGRKMFFAVAIFGVATCIFALSRSYLLSLCALFLIGSSDMISVVIRHSIVQLQTPDHLRGRVSAVNQVFIGASNELGEFESGLTAHWFGSINAVLIGGVGTICVVIAWSKIFPSLYLMNNIEPRAD